MSMIYIKVKVECAKERGLCNLKILISDTGQGISKDIQDSFNNEEYTLITDKSSNMEG